jgi:hypothetical protein
VVENSTNYSENQKTSDVDDPKYRLIFYLFVEQIKNYFGGE